ncbi:hypothetical protein NDU88_000849 [Pleurodeles waltl]|uniref:Uncharacterized protein n=1 Tax=Pleurodeles waltl TaxID=8319 RepID=A0AAV7P526_PLEWA|nr:hypothetical protein NDU88_000849 [Pleurodeles waltl]
MTDRAAPSTATNLLWRGGVADHRRHTCLAGRQSQVALRAHVTQPSEATNFYHPGGVIYSRPTIRHKEKKNQALQPTPTASRARPPRKAHHTARHRTEHGVRGAHGLTPTADPVPQRVSTGGPGGEPPKSRGASSDGPERRRGRKGCNPQPPHHPQSPLIQEGQTPARPARMCTGPNTSLLGRAESALPSPLSQLHFIRRVSSMLSAPQQRRNISTISRSDRINVGLMPLPCGASQRDGHLPRRPGHTLTLRVLLLKATHLPSCNGKQ